AWRSRSVGRGARDARRPVPGPDREAGNGASACRSETLPVSSRARKRASGGIGRRTGFRFRRRDTWRFESSLAHKSPANRLGFGRERASGEPVAASPLLRSHESSLAHKSPPNRLGFGRERASGEPVAASPLLRSHESSLAHSSGMTEETDTSPGEGDVG